jgi:DtxR family transcriptional regulator, Mn-dependent transcriptional regulator
VRDEYHPPLEEYLQVIEQLSDDGVTVIQARVAERLNKTAPSVSEMIERLVDDGYVTRNGRELQLTTNGHDVARSVMRKHRLAERLLADVIGLPWHLIHEEAGRWEHVMSDEVEKRIVALLGDPGTCPHGNPIPGSVNEVTDRHEQRPMADRDEGDVFRFARITEEAETDFQSLSEFNDVGFLPTTTASILTKNADGSIELDVNGSPLRIRQKMTRQLFVVPVA